MFLLKTKSRASTLLSCMTPCHTYPKDLTFYSTDTHLAVIIVALFTIARKWEQLRCPSTDESIKKVWYMYTMEYYSIAKKKEIIEFTSKCMELETVVLSEGIHIQAFKYHNIPHICRSCLLNTKCGYLSGNKYG